jgi:hypothetical protein
VTPKETRATAFGLVGVSVALAGGLGGALLTGAAESFWGERMAVAVTAPTASVLAGLVLLLAARHVLRDIARVADLR